MDEVFNSDEHSKDRAARVAIVKNGEVRFKKVTEMLTLNRHPVNTATVFAWHLYLNSFQGWPFYFGQEANNHLTEILTDLPDIPN